MRLQTCGDLQIEFHDNNLVTIANVRDHSGAIISASADDVSALLSDIMRDDGTYSGLFQLQYETVAFAYVITHRHQPGSVVLTSYEYRVIKAALLERAISD